MALTGTIVANLIANTTKFSQPMKRAGKDVQTLETRLKSLQKSVTGLPLRFLTLEKGLSFFRNTIRDATTLDTKLNTSLSDDLRNSAKELSESFASINLSLQQATLTALDKFSPIIDHIARQARFISEMFLQTPGQIQRTVFTPAGATTGLDSKTAILERLKKNNARMQQLSKSAGLAAADILSPLASFQETRKQLIEMQGIQNETRFLTNRLDMMESGTLPAEPVKQLDLFTRLKNRFFPPQPSGPLADIAAAVGNRFAGLGGSASRIQAMAEAFGGGAAGFLGGAARNQFRTVDAIADRVARLRDEQPRRPGAFERGREDTLDEIARIAAANRGDSGEDLSALVEIAKEQLETEKKLADELSRAIGLRLPTPARF